MGTVLVQRSLLRPGHQEELQGEDSSAVTVGAKAFHDSIELLPRNFDKSAELLGVSLHFLTDLLQPMHAVNFTALSVPLVAHSTFEGYAEDRVKKGYFKGYPRHYRGPEPRAALRQCLPSSGRSTVEASLPKLPRGPARHDQARPQVPSLFPSGRGRSSVEAFALAGARYRRPIPGSVGLPGKSVERFLGRKHAPWRYRFADRFARRFAHHPSSRADASTALWRLGQPRRDSPPAARRRPRSPRRRPTSKR